MDEKPRIGMPLRAVARMLANGGRVDEAGTHFPVPKQKPVTPPHIAEQLKAAAESKRALRRAKKVGKL